MKERIVIIFIAVTLGLLATTIGFFLYESSKPAHQINEKPTASPIKPAPKDNIKLTINQPKDESVTTNRNITVKGVTDPQNTIIIASNTDAKVIKPQTNGNFTVSLVIDSGVNELIIQAISPNGESKKIVQTVSFTADSF